MQTLNNACKYKNIAVKALRRAYTALLESRATKKYRFWYKAAPR